MESVVKIASYICQRYLKDFGEQIDEMKLHKLLYFTQRECIIQTDQPLFEDSFSAWKYGPVVVSIRQLYKGDALHDLPSDDVIEKFKPVFDKVFEQYAPKSSLSLSSLSHREYSWQHARGSADRDERCDTYLDLHDIEKDAERIKIRRIMLKKLREVEEKEALE
jgi:uncharacterized phage-associated protein